MRIILFLCATLLTSNLFATNIKLNIVDYKTDSEIIPEQILVTDLETNETYIFNNTSFIDTQVLTGIEETSSLVEGIKIFPNPVAEKCFIEISSNENKTDYLLFVNSLGSYQKIQIQLSKGLNKFNLSQHNLPLGNYYVSTSKYKTILNISARGKSNSIILNKINADIIVAPIRIPPSEKLYSIKILQSNYINHTIAKTDLTDLPDDIKLIKIDDIEYVETEYMFYHISANMTRLVEDEPHGYKEEDFQLSPKFAGKIEGNKFSISEQTDVGTDYVDLKLKVDGSDNNYDFTLSVNLSFRVEKPNFFKDNYFQLYYDAYDLRYNSGYTDLKCNDPFSNDEWFNDGTINFSSPDFVKIICKIKE